MATVSLCLHLGTAEAKLTDVGQCSAKVVSVTVDERLGGNIKLLVNPKKLTTLNFDFPVTKTSRSPDQLYIDRIGQQRIDIKMLKRAMGQKLGNILVHTGEWPMSVEFEYTSDPDRVPGVLHIVTRSSAERLRQQALRNALRLFVDSEDLLAPGERVPRNQPAFSAAEASSTPYAEIAHVPRTDAERYFVFDVYNHSSRLFELDAIQLIVNGQTTIPVDTIYFDRAGEPARGIHTIIPPRQRARGALRLPPATRDVEIDDLVIALHELRGGLPLTATAQTTRRYEIAPITEEELRLRQRDREARGRVTIQVQPMYGAIWLANPLRADKLEATSLTGLGLRVAYGFNRYFSLEGELAAASSGSAGFDGMTFQDQQGVVLRNARLGRAQLGGMLRLGQTYVPTARLGIGFQGISHNTRFVPETGGEMAGPDLGFEAKAYFSFGAGFDVRLGNRWSIGWLASFAQSIGTEISSVTTGIHLSYGWKP